MTTNTIRNGASITISLLPTETLKVVAVSGTYALAGVAGSIANTTLATGATGGTYGPYSAQVTVRLMASSLSEIDFDSGTAPVIESDTVARIASDPLTGVVGFSAPDGGVIGSGVSAGPIKADGVTDDSAAFQDAINFYSETNKGRITLPRSSTIKLNSGITFRAGAVFIDLNGSTLDFSGMGSGYAITVNPPFDPYGETANTGDILVNGYIKGPVADATTVDGIKIDRVTSGTVQTQQPSILTM